jgi:hypothetical protein
VSALEVRDLTFDFVDRLAVLLPDLADELVTLSGDDVDLVVRQFSPPLTDFSLQLLPVSFDRVRIHDLLPRQRLGGQRRRLT